MDSRRGRLDRAAAAAVAVALLGLSGCAEPMCGDCGPPAAVCGDGVVQAPETCDDGNRAGGDGCAANCGVEAGFTCAGAPSVCEPAPPAGVVVERCAALAPTAGALCQVTPGGAALLLEGTVLLPGRVLRGGQVAVDAAGVITCVGCGCAAGAPGATRVTCPQGVLSPGLVNALDRLSFAQNAPRVDTGERYEHRHDWRLGQRGHTRLTFAGLATEAEQQWAELRQVLAGTTSILGSGGAAGLLRNLDRADLREGLAGPPADLVAFPLGDQAGTRLESGCGYPAIVTPAALAADPAALLSAAEGLDASAANELACLSSTASGGQDVLAPQVALAGAVAAGPAQLAQLAARGAALVWSPRSNLALYGDTVRVTEAARLGVRLALGTDWAVSGSSTLLRELACADAWNRERLAGFFTDEQLWRMATQGAAGAAGVADALGELAPGRQADLVVFAGQARRDYRAVLDAGPGDVALVLRGGRTLHGDAALVEALEGAACEPLDVCGVPKRTCLSRELGTGFAALAAANAGRPPAFSCGAPPGEPACVPARPASVNGSTVYTGARGAGDADGDGIPDALDLCPAVFDPIRPQDGGRQADADGDGVGDACDPCPLLAGALACPAASGLAPGGPVPPWR